MYQPNKWKGRVHPCVCLHMCLRVCVHIHALCLGVLACAHVCTCLFLCASICIVCVGVHMCVPIFACVHMDIYCTFYVYCLCIHACVYVYMWLCVCKCVGQRLWARSWGTSRICFVCPSGRALSRAELELNLVLQGSRRLFWAERPSGGKETGQRPTSHDCRGPGKWGLWLGSVQDRWRGWGEGRIMNQSCGFKS